MPEADVNPPRVLLVGPLPPPAGGMANQTAQLARLLSGDGVPVEVVATNAAYGPAWLRRVRFVRAAARLPGYLRALWRACGRADVVHVMANSGWSWHLHAAPAVWVARARRRPVVVNYRGGLAAEFFARRWWAVAPTLRRAQAIIVPSPFLQRVFARHGMRAGIVRNIVELPAPPGGAGRPAGAGPRILVARNLEPIYDVGTAIDAFARLRAQIPAARLLVAGDGPERAALEAKARALGLDGAVEFLGNLDNAELLREMASCDCLLNTSREDNTPISILEALALGVPVVSTAAGGIPDLVTDGASALLAPVGDADAVAQATCRALQDQALRARLTAGGRQVAALHAWPSVRDALLAAYAMAAGGRSARRVVDRPVGPVTDERAGQHEVARPSPDGPA